MAQFSLIGRNIQAPEGYLLPGLLLRPRRGYWYEEPGEQEQERARHKECLQAAGGMHPPSVLHKVCAHMNVKEPTIRTTQSQIDALITEQWVTSVLDNPGNKDFVNQTAGMHRFRSFSARGLAHSTGFFTSAQLPMRRSEQKSQHWPRRN